MPLWPTLCVTHHVLSWSPPCADFCPLFLNYPEFWPQELISYSWWFAVNICLASDRLGHEDEIFLNEKLSLLNWMLVLLNFGKHRSHQEPMSHPKASAQPLALTVISASPHTPIVCLFSDLSGLLINHYGGYSPPSTLGVWPLHLFVSLFIYWLIDSFIDDENKWQKCDSFRFMNIYGLGCVGPPCNEIIILAMGIRSCQM